MDASRAGAMLAAAATAQQQTLRAGRWYVRWTLVYAGASFVCGLAIGLIPNLAVSMTVFAVVWGSAITGLSVYAARQRVAPCDFKKVHFRMFASWAVLWGMLVIAGRTWFPHEPVWWVPGSALAAVPALVAAFVVHRAVWREFR